MAVFLRKDVNLAIDKVLSCLCKISISSRDDILQNEKQKIVVKTPLQACVEYRFSEALERSIHKIIIDACYQAELISPGSFIKTLTSIKKNFDKNDDESNLVSLVPKIDDIKNMILGISDDHVLNSIIFEAISMAGFRGNISIEKSLNSTSSVELIDGYTFKHKPIGDFKPIKLTKPKIILIDGYVESVAEINKLFQEASESKHPLILVARGMHDDVLTTIKVNRDRSTMIIYPVIIEFDLSGINTIVDMCVVSGCLPVSQNLGNLISSISLEEAKTIDECAIINDSIIIRNSKTRNSVNLHLNSLIQKRNSNQEETEGLLTKRIKSLTNSNVVIRLPNDATYIHKSQMIDYALRSLKSMLDFGIESSNNDLYATTKIAEKQSKKVAIQLQSIDCFLD